MRKINAAVVGLGVGYFHAKSIINHKNYNLKKVYDVDKKKIKKFKDEYEKVIITSNFKEIINDKDIELICIATHDNDHFKHIKEALKLNKNIFVEKPICVNFKQFKSLEKILNKKPNIKISSNFVLRCHPSIIRLKEFIKKGLIGDVYYIEGDYNYGRLNKITDGWRSKQSNYSVFLGGGIHLFDLINYILDFKKIKSYNSIGNKIATKKTKFKYEDFKLLNIKYADNIISKISSNFGCVYPHSHFLKVYGTKGTFFMNYKEEIFVRNLSGKFIFKNKKIVACNAYKNEPLNSFLNFICNNNKKSKPIVSKKELLNLTKFSTIINENKKIK